MSPFWQKDPKVGLIMDSQHHELILHLRKCPHYVSIPFSKEKAGEEEDAARHSFWLRQNFPLLGRGCTFLNNESDFFVIVVVPFISLSLWKGLKVRYSPPLALAASTGYKNNTLSRGMQP